MADLLALAMQAMHDPAALVVLQDALEETGFERHRFYFGDLRPVATANADGVGHLEARAVAAVLLFGEWSTDPWSLVLASMSSDFFLETARGAHLDRIAETLFGLRRHQPHPLSREPMSFETDEELRARCRAAVDRHRPQPRRLRMTLMVEARSLVVAPEDVATQDWLRTMPLERYAEVEAIGRDVARPDRIVRTNAPPHDRAAEYAARLRALFPYEQIEVAAVLG